jgi:hypothetical protein
MKEYPPLFEASSVPGLRWINEIYSSYRDFKILEAARLVF